MYLYVLQIYSVLQMYSVLFAMNYVAGSGGDLALLPWLGQAQEAIRLLKIDMGSQH